MIEDIAKQIVEMVKKKNCDYGGAFFITRERFGAVAFLIRLLDKVNRLERMVETGKAFYESYEDTIMDIVGYCLLELEYLKKQQEVKE